MPKKVRKARVGAAGDDSGESNKAECEVASKETAAVPGTATLVQWCKETNPLNLIGAAQRSTTQHIIAQHNTTQQKHKTTYTAQHNITQHITI